MGKGNSVEGRIMEWAGKGSHLGGIPRKMVISSVSAFAKAVTSLLNNTTVHNPETLINLTHSRPPGVPLITVSNHMSTLDDPFMWGFKDVPVSDCQKARWTLAAEDICFTNPLFSYFFRLGKCIPINRGRGIYQTHMNEALEIINKGDWLHTFPEGKISQDSALIRRLKWGTASLIARSSVQPIVLPIAHSGFENVMPEKHWFGRRPPFPLALKKISIVIGEPLNIDLDTLQKKAISFSEAFKESTLSRDENTETNRIYLQNFGWPSELCRGLDEIAQKWLFIHISEHIRNVLQDLFVKARAINNSRLK